MSSSFNFPSWTHHFDVEEHEDTYVQLFKDVINSDRLLFGNELVQFEKEFSSFIGSSYGIGCDNATNGIFLALRALGIGKGDQVLTVPNTAIPTVSAICQSGATPIFCDVNEYGLIDLSSFDIANHPSLKAVIPVHLFGFPCDMDVVMEFSHRNNVIVIEDCSQAHGTKYYDELVGSFADLSVFSFYQPSPWVD